MISAKCSWLLEACTLSLYGVLLCLLCFAQASAEVAFTQNIKDSYQFDVLDAR